MREHIVKSPLPEKFTLFRSSQHSQGIIRRRGYNRVVSNRQILDEAIECFGDPQRRHEYFRLYSNDIVLHGYQGVIPGLESVKQFYSAFWRVFPDAALKVQEVIEQGEMLAVRYVITGTQHEPFMGVAAERQPIELPGISFLHFRNGRCFERWACSDSMVLLNQIGAVHFTS